MSMSQEEIEALMSGLDIEDDNTDLEESAESIKVNTQEIEELLSQTENYNEEEKIGNEPEEHIVNNKEKSSAKTDEIEQLLNDIETGASIDEECFDNLKSLEKVSPIVDNLKSDKISPSKKDNRSDDDIVNAWTSSKIEEGIFPFPAEKDTKVVNQLSQVANDSEEKVSQIFDVLSITLDNNNEIRGHIKSMELFVASQVSLLQSLNTKFPNINVFNEYLGNTNDVTDTLNTLKILMNDEDTQIFQAMELMQFNDINRQKIERVMSVIRKLSLYLNNLFEDDGSSKNVAVAKHIHGDDTNDLIGDDLDKLIAEFSNNK
jgi:hypothetical protein